MLSTVITKIQALPIFTGSPEFFFDKVKSFGRSGKSEKFDKQKRDLFKTNSKLYFQWGRGWILESFSPCRGQTMDEETLIQIHFPQRFPDPDPF